MNRNDIYNALPVDKRAILIRLGVLNEFLDALYFNWHYRSYRTFVDLVERDITGLISGALNWAGEEMRTGFDWSKVHRKLCSEIQDIDPFTYIIL